MAHVYKIEAARDYATKENAIKAVEKKFPEADNDGLRYFIHQGENGRFFPVFFGPQAINGGVHFHFNVIG